MQLMVAPCRQHKQAVPALVVTVTPADTLIPVGTIASCFEGMIVVKVGPSISADSLPAFVPDTGRRWPCYLTACLICGPNDAPCNCG